MKARWRVLTKKIDLKLEDVPNLIYACFVLHNFCESKNICIDERLIQQQIDRNQSEEEIFRKYIPDSIYCGTSDEGKMTRDVLVSYIESSI